MDKINKRNDFLDFIKGIAIILVVWGHSIQYLSPTYIGNKLFYENYIFKLIYSFHMPLLMFVSGVLFWWSCQKQSDIKKIVMSRMHSLVCPMLLWGGISCALFDSTKFFSITADSINVIINYLFSFWFLWSVFISSTLLGISYKFSNNINMFIKILTITIIISAILPPQAYLNTFMYPYFILGFLTNKYKNKLRSLPIGVWCVLGICYILLLPQYETKHYIYVSKMSWLDSGYDILEQLNIDVYRYLIGTLGVIFFLLIAQMVYSFFKAFKLSRLIYKIGKNSLQIYILQRIIIELFGSRCMYRFQKILPQVFKNRGDIFNDIIISIVALLLTILISFGVDKISKYQKISKILFGR